MNLLVDAIGGGTNVTLPPGEFWIINETYFPPSGITIRGAGAGRTIIRCASNLGPAHAIVLNGRNDCLFEDFTLDCNATGRGLTVDSGFNGYNVQGARNVWNRVEVIDAPRFGILLDGNTIPTYENRIEDCHIYKNGGTGVAINKASNNKILGNRFRDQGWENLTIDVNCFGNVVTNNHFYAAQLNGGGCGNIGWDDSDGSIFSNNVIDSGRAGTPADPPQANGNIIGICINSEAGVTTGSVISNNVIVNCRDYGIYLKNRTGEDNVLNLPNWNPGKAGDTVISNNYVRSLGLYDIRINDTDELVVLTGNNYQSIKIDDPDALNVRLSAGEAAIELNLPTEELAVIGRYSRVLFASATFQRSISQSGGIVSIPCGGLYALSTQVRFDKTATPGVTAIQLRIVTPSGEIVYNQPIPAGLNVGEIQLSALRLLKKGEVYVEVYPFGTGGFIKLLPGNESWLSVTSMG